MCGPDAQWMSTSKIDLDRRTVFVNCGARNTAAFSAQRVDLQRYASKLLTQLCGKPVEELCSAPRFMHRKLCRTGFFELPNRALESEHTTRTRKRDGRSFAASETTVRGSSEEPRRSRGGHAVKGKGRLPGQHPKSSDDGLSARQVKSADGVGSSEPLSSEGPSVPGRWAQRGG